MPVTSARLTAFIALIRAVECETNPADPSAPDHAETGVRASFARYDFTRSDSSWMLLASVNDTPAGYAAVVRVPKVDARVGFLFADELYVLQTYRHMGVARALLAQVEDIARDFDLHGMRLLVRHENDTARRLYRGAGFSENDTILCQKGVKRDA